ncbi:hypothetical protein [Stella sp.]|uniref:hypothetical protein n=1 Tax=Stella sp. TaxID=2912054 RepID=UPI0035B4EC89
MLAALLVSALPASALAQTIEVKVGVTNNSSYGAWVAWSKDTGETKPPVSVSAGQTAEFSDYWLPMSGATAQNHVLTITLPGQRACRAALRVEVGYAMPGMPTLSSLTCSIQEQSSHGLSCSLDAQGTAVGTGSPAGTCTAAIRFGG